MGVLAENQRSAFKEFHALVEHESGKKLKCLKSDNGGEYVVLLKPIAKCMTSK